MITFLFSIAHIVICIALIFFILIQSNKGMGLSGAFGAVGAGDNFLSASNAFNILVKITVTLSILFAASSLGLSYFATGGSSGPSSLMEEFETAPQPVSEMFKEQAAPSGGQPIEAQPEEAAGAPPQE